MSEGPPRKRNLQIGRLDGEFVVNDAKLGFCTLRHAAWEEDPKTGILAILADE